jgi:hypothetical protein
MRILYVTWNVLGDAGANAAELFPRYSMLDDAVTKVIVADDGKNRRFIQKRQLAQFLRLRRSRFPFVAQLRAAVRIARTAKREQMDVIHIFYRLENVPLAILLRLALLMTGASAKVIMDHRSVNLARGFKAFWKKLANLAMQPFVHVLAGNPWAVETNHWWVWKPKRILDLGYDTLPPNTGQGQIDPAARTVWFIGSLKPRNRKSEFLISVFDEMARRLGPQSDIVVRVAGPTRPEQKKALRGNPIVTYYGSLPRMRLYELLNEFPGVGVAFMNREFHEYAPSLKFCEYAIMRYRIVAADTLGLQTQARRMNLPGVAFAKETVADWADHLIEAARNMDAPQPLWADAPLWSYDSIYLRQVRALHRELSAGRA